jgi:hypothetical protein
MRLLWRDQSANKPDRELLWFAISVGSIAGGAAWLALALPWPHCPFFAVTGVPCVTCGATRSVIAFLHGDLLSAFRWNPLAFVAFCALLAFDLYAAIVILARMPRLRIVDWTTTEKNTARIMLISLLALNWIYLLAHRGRF